jgi:hypothetical protein
VKYFLDAFGISAREQIKLKKREEWEDMLESFVDDPQSATNHLVMGMSVDQRREARGKNTNKTITWF